MIHIFVYVLFIDGVHVLLRHEYDTYISFLLKGTTIKLTV